MEQPVMKQAEIYSNLSAVDMSEYIVTDQGGHRYIKWADALAVLLKIYPEATFEQHKDALGNAFHVSSLGIEVTVSVTIEGLTKTFTHPVLNAINKAMKIEGYSYKTKAGERQVEAATTFDINTARMRALVKCIGLFGLGLYLYRDDLAPEIETLTSKQLQEVIDAVKRKGLILTDVCKAWNVHKIAQIHAENFDTMINWIEGR